MGSSLRILGVTEIKVPAPLSSLMVRPLAHFIQLSITRAVFSYCLYYSNLIFSAIPYCLKFPWFEIRNRNRPAFRTNDIQWYYFFTCCQKLSAAWTMNHSVFIISFIISHFHPNSRVFHYSPINITIPPSILLSLCCSISWVHIWPFSQKNRVFPIDFSWPSD